MLLAHWNNLSLLFLLSAVFLAESQYDLNEQLILTMMSTIIMHFGLLKLDILLFINLFCLENKVKKKKLTKSSVIACALSASGSVLCTYTSIAVVCCRHIFVD